MLWFLYQRLLIMRFECLFFTPVMFYALGRHCLHGSLEAVFVVTAAVVPAIFGLMLDLLNEMDRCLLCRFTHRLHVLHRDDEVSRICEKQPDHGWFLCRGCRGGVTHEKAIIVVEEAPIARRLGLPMSAGQREPSPPRTSAEN